MVITNDKGFTLIELIITVAIMGVITIIAFPAIISLQSSNEIVKYEAYADSLGSNARVYINNFEKDVFPDEDTECFVVSYSMLYTNDLIKNIDVEDVTCINSFVKVTLKDGVYSYETSTECSKDGDIVYKAPEKDINIDSCVVKSDGPPDIIVEASDRLTYKKSHNFNINIFDGDTLFDNSVIKYAWSRLDDSSLLSDIDYIEYQYNNKYGLPEISYETKTSDSLKKYSLEKGISYDPNDTWYLHVKASGVDVSTSEVIDTKENKRDPNDVIVTSFNLDNIPPDIPSIKNPTGGNWTNKDFALELGINEGCDRIGHWRYSYDGVTWKNYKDLEILPTSNANSCNVVTTDFSKERDQDVYISVCDTAGLCSEANKTPIKLDKTKPTVPTSTVKYDNSGGTVRSNSDQSFTHRDLWWGNFSSDDDMSGIKENNAYQYSYGCTGIANEKYLGVYHFYNFDINAGICIRSIDNAGNYSNWSSPTYIKIAKTPGVPLISNPTNGNWVNYNYSLTLKASSSVSVGYYQYSYDNVNWSTYSNSGSQSYVTPALSAEQNRKIYIRACSAGGSCSASTYTYLRIDKTAPSVPRVSTVTEDGAAYASYEKNDMWTNKNIIVTLSSTDNLSGVSSYKYYQAYKYGAGATIPLTSTNYGVNKIKHQVEQNNSFHYMAYDKAGNVSSVTWPGSTDWVWINIDKTPPITFFTASPGIHYVGSGGKLGFHIANHDQGAVQSGPGRTLVHTYYPNGYTKVEESFNNSGQYIELPQNDNHYYTVHVQVFDRAGNKQVHVNTNQFGWYFNYFHVKSAPPAPAVPTSTCKIRGSKQRNKGVWWTCSDGTHSMYTYYQVYCSDSNGNITPKSSPGSWVCGTAPYGAESGWHVIDDSAW